MKIIILTFFLYGICGSFLPPGSTDLIESGPDPIRIRNASTLPSRIIYLDIDRILSA
jgi:hypothetical protein